MFGFTIIEFLVGISILSIVVVVALTNVRTLRAENRDNQAKSDINTLVFQLESFYEKNGYYPQVVDSQTLAAVDADVFVDSRGNTVGKDSTLYKYLPRSCSESKCKSYEASAILEREAPYIKESLNS